MNKAEVQEVYDKVITPRSISAIETLGLKSCLFYDLFGTYSVENISDTDIYIQVKSKIESLCEYALNAKSEPVAKDCNGDPICIGGTVWYDDEEYLVHAHKPKSAHDDERILCTCCDAWQTPRWLYLGGDDVTVRNPNGQSDSLESMRDAIQAVIYSLQKDVFDKLEEALKSPSEAQKD
jgi:hypothetical protein|nr:MAG TPA: hypothetical protein [Bacteriophage sp.]